MESGLLFAIVVIGFLLYWYGIRPEVKAKGGLAPAMRSMFGQGQPETPDQKFIAQADQLFAEVKRSVDRSSLSPERKRELLGQAAAVPTSVRAGVERLDQLQRLRAVSQERGAAFAEVAEVIALENKTRAEINHSLDLLTRIPINMAKLDAERDTAYLERTMAELSDANARLQDMTDAAKELRATN